MRCRGRRARQLPAITPEIAQGNAHFRLGTWLRHHGREAEGDRHLAEASRLHPDSWIIWRQAADLQEAGKAGGPEFWARVQSLGDKPYYPPADLPGVAKRIISRHKVSQPRYWLDLHELSDEMP